MSQQINLYQLEEKPESIYFTFLNMLRITVVFLFILAIFSIGKFIAYYNTQKEFYIVKDKKQSLEKQFEQAQGKIPAKEEKEQLVQQIKELEAMSAHMQKMQNILKQLQYKELGGFADFLVALAHYNVPELWLTEIKISAGGETIRLSGKTTNAENVPKFLQQLAKNKVFYGKTFSTIKILVDEQEKIIKFKVGSD